MKMKTVAMIILLLGFIIALDGIYPRPSTAAAASKSAPIVQAKPAWQDEWDKTLAAARKEGKVSILATVPMVKDGVAGAFKEKFGIDVELFIGTVNEIAAKVGAERRAEIYLRDLAMGGSTGLSAIVSKAMEETFILPEVRDPMIWKDKRLPFYDKDGKIFMYISRVGPTLAINRELVKQEELKSWRSLLDPKWKGKILVFDPTMEGAGNSIIAAVGDIMGVEFLRELARQEPVINRDKRLQLEWIARGKSLIGLGFDFSLFEELRSAGVPLTHLVPAEGSYFGSAVGSMVMVDKPAHPNAAKVFVNWFLSKEGQALFAKTAKEQSRRIDVPPGIAADRLFQEGVKYIDFDTADMFRKRTEMLKLSKDIFQLK